MDLRLRLNKLLKRVGEDKRAPTRHFQNTLLKRGVNVRNTQEGIDTTTPFGEAMAKVIVVFAEMEHSWIRERTKSGLQAAKARGKSRGRARKMTPEQEEMARTLEENKVPVVQICQTLGISRATFYRQIAPKKQEKPVSD